MRRLTWAACAVWLLTLAACGHDDGHAPGHGVAAIIADAQTPFDSEGLSSRSFAPSRPTSPVAMNPLPPGVAAFEVLARTPQLKQAPCAGCHTKSIEVLVRSRPANEPRAHWAVSLAHASDAVMTCATCHDGAAPGQLRLLGGTPLTLDHAYLVCAQCHSTQARDWAGGAHGKQVGGWAPPRVSYSCTECHNPHRPALTTRWPTEGGR